MNLTISGHHLRSPAMRSYVITKLGLYPGISMVTSKVLLTVDNLKEKTCDSARNATFTSKRDLFYGMCAHAR
jgi:hypothetical protein